MLVANLLAQRVAEDLNDTLAVQDASRTRADHYLVLRNQSLDIAASSGVLANDQGIECDNLSAVLWPKVRPMGCLSWLPTVRSASNRTRVSPGPIGLATEQQMDKATRRRRG